MAELADFHPGTSHRHDCAATVSSDNPCDKACIHDLYAVAEDAARPFEPPGLRELVESITYKAGWMFYLEVFSDDGGGGHWAFHVVSDTADSYQPDRRIRVNHEFLIPPASYNRDVWALWIRDRIAAIEGIHELGEFLMFDGYREFAPHHGNGEDPYVVWHVGDHAAARKKAGQD